MTNNPFKITLRLIYITRLLLYFMCIVMKKLSYVISSLFIVGLVIVSTQSNFSFANQPTPPEHNWERMGSGQWGEVREVRHQQREKRHDMLEENKDEYNQERLEKRKAFGKEIKAEIFANLDEETHNQLRTINEAHKAQVKALREQYDDTRSEELHLAIKALSDQRDADIIALLPEDLAVQYQNFIQEVKAEHEADRAEHKEERKELINNHFSETTVLVVEKINTLLDKVTIKFAGDTDKIDTFYTKISNKISGMITHIEENEKLSETLKAQRIEVLEAVIVSIQEKQAALNTDQVDTTEQEIAEILEAILE